MVESSSNEHERTNESLESDLNSDEESMAKNNIEADISNFGGDVDTKEASSNFSNLNNEDSSSDTQDDFKPDLCSTRNFRRTHTKLVRYGYGTNKFGVCVVATRDSPSIQDAMNFKKQETKLWKVTVENGLTNLLTKGTGENLEVIPSAARKPLPTHVILKIKRDQSGNVSKVKERLFVGGNLQRKGNDFYIAYAPLLDFTFMILTLLVCHSGGSSVLHVDVEAAALSEDIDRDVFVSHLTTDYPT